MPQYTLPKKETGAISELLDLAIATHGGMQRWEQIHTCSAQLAAYGALLAMKGATSILGRPGGEFLFQGAAHVQQVTISPTNKPAGCFCRSHVSGPKIEAIGEARNLT